MSNNKHLNTMVTWRKYINRLLITINDTILSYNKPTTINVNPFEYKD